MFYAGRDSNRWSLTANACFNGTAASIMVSIRDAFTIWRVIGPLHFSQGIGLKVQGLLPFFSVLFRLAQRVLRCFPRRLQSRSFHLRVCLVQQVGSIKYYFPSSFLRKLRQDYSAASKSTQESALAFTVIYILVFRLPDMALDGFIIICRSLYWF